MVLEFASVLPRPVTPQISRVPVAMRIPVLSRIRPVKVIPLYRLITHLPSPTTLPTTLPTTPSTIPLLPTTSIPPPPPPIASTTVPPEAPQGVQGATEAPSPPPATYSPSPAPTGDQSTLAILACIAGYESGGNPAENTGNSYYGMYQFSSPTWDYAVTAAGSPQYANGRADLAPADVQTAAAVLLASQNGFEQPWPVTSRMCNA
jgi:Transglycosylase-like domain